MIVDNEETSDENDILPHVFFLSIIKALSLLVISILATHYSSLVSSFYASNPVTDIILSNSTARDLQDLFIVSTFVLLGFVISTIISHPRSIPFAIESIALFYIIRACFVVMTHISPYPDIIVSSSYLSGSWLLAYFFTSGDLFFSGHVGLPVLMACIYWHNFRIRSAYIASAFFMAIVVLLGHIHYTIDVVAAFFIVPTIHRISAWLFRKDADLLLIYSTK